jgi:hypothetical protein
MLSQNLNRRREKRIKKLCFSHPFSNVDGNFRFSELIVTDSGDRVFEQNPETEHQSLLKLTKR